MFLNNFPAMWIQYDTTQPVSIFIASQCFDALPDALFVALLVLPASYVGNYVTVRAFPQHAPFSHVFTGVFWRSKPVLLAVFVGICLACCHSAFYNIFYLVGRSIGVWCPLKTPYTAAVAWSMPWVKPFEDGFVAALSEETLYRLFAISALLLLTKRRWLSILIPAIVWGFLHSNYPQEPIFIRGLEVSLVGIAYGYVFVQYGIMATMVSHFTYNALAGGNFFLRSDNSYLILCALIVLLLPFIPLVMAGLMRLRGKTLASLNEVTETPLHKWKFSPKTVNASWNSLKQYPRFMPVSKWIFAILGVGAFGATALFVFGHFPETFGDFIRVTVSRQEAQQIADTYLHSQGVNLDSYRRVTSFYTDLRGAETDYCWEKGTRNDLHELNRIFQTRFKDRSTWRTWYFQPGNMEEYVVETTSTGQILAIKHYIAEDAPGARLSEQAARDIAETELRTQGLPVARYKLVSAENYEYPNRRDYTFTFEDGEEAVGDAHFRKKVVVQGDQIGWTRSYLELPEKWEREYAKLVWWKLVLGILVAIFIMTYFVRWALLLEALSKLKLLSFRPYVPFVLVGIFSYFFMILNFPTIPWSFYSVTEELSVFWIKIILFVLCYCCGGLILGTVVCGYIGATFRYAFPACRPLTNFFSPRTDDHLPLRLVWGEALLLGCLFSLIMLGVYKTMHSDSDWNISETLFFVLIGVVVRFAFPTCRLLPSWFKSTVDGNLPIRFVWIEALLMGCLFSFSWIGLHEQFNDGMHSSIRNSAPLPVDFSFLNLRVPVFHVVTSSFYSGVLLCFAGIWIVSLYKIYWDGLWRAVLLSIGCGVIFACIFAKTLSSALLVTFSVTLITLGFIGVLRILVRYIYRDNLPAYLMSIMLQHYLFAGLTLVALPNTFYRINGIILLACFGICGLVGLWLYVSGMRRGITSHESIIEEESALPVVE